jgi:uncharacterized membrane protein
MRHLKSVTVLEAAPVALGGQRPMGASVEWDAEIHNERRTS